MEVIIVDDGSMQPAPAYIRKWNKVYPLALIAQPHKGISSARNEGIRHARGSLLVFVDADCILEPNCLETLKQISDERPEHYTFQLHLLGHSHGIVGRSEELRLRTLQDHLLQPDGSIRYLNTAGFAIRRKHATAQDQLFEPTVSRAEDTLLLANLMRAGEMPQFVSEARVQHDVSLTLRQCIRKEIRSAYLEKSTWDIIEKMNVSIRVSYRERLRMLRNMWRLSAQNGIGRSAWFLLVGRQLLRLAVFFVAEDLPKVKSKMHQSS